MNKGLLFLIFLSVVMVLWYLCGAIFLLSEPTFKSFDWLDVPSDFYRYVMFTWNAFLEGKDISYFLLVRVAAAVFLPLILGIKTLVVFWQRI